MAKTLRINHKTHLIVTNSIVLLPKASFNKVFIGRHYTCTNGALTPRDLEKVMEEASSDTLKTLRSYLPARLISKDIVHTFPTLIHTFD